MQTIDCVLNGTAIFNRLQNLKFLLPENKAIENRRSTLNNKKMVKRNIDPEKRRKLSQMFYEMREKGLSKMRIRHAGFMAIVREYTSFEDFLHDWEDLMTLFGTEVYAGSDGVGLRIQIDYTDYEEYHVIMGKDGHLTMSAAAWWQNECCANELTNIFTGESLEVDDIDTCFPPESDNI